MKNAFLLSAAVAASLGFAAVDSANSAVVFEHTGSNDPVSEGFSNGLSSDTVTSADAGPPANWRMATPATTGATSGYGTYDYNSTPAFEAALVDPTGWTFTMIVRLNDANEVYESSIRVKDASNRLEMHLIDGTGPLAAGVYYTNTVGVIDSGSLISSIDPTSGFHTYQMIKDPNGAGAADDEIHFYVNGALALSTLQSNLYGAGGAAQHFFGDATYADGVGVDHQYALVRLETGQVVVPEPAGLAVLGIAAGGMILGRNRRNRA